MFPVTRLFESEQTASDAVDKLVAGDVPRDSIAVLGASQGDTSASIDAAIEQGVVMSGHRGALQKALSNGRSIVSVSPEYGRGRFVEITLEQSGAVDTRSLPDYLPDAAAPFSDFLGLPVLTSGKSHLTLFDFDGTSSFGLRFLSKKAAPLSSMFGLKVLSSGKGSVAKGSAVESMSGTPAPLSSKLGLKLLSSKKNKSSDGSSVTRMSSNAAPFSAFLGLPVLTKRK